MNFLIRYSFRFPGGLFLVLASLAVTTVQAQTTNYVLGTQSLVVGPASGSNSVVLAVSPATGAWTATNNAAWLHLSPANQRGTGSTNVVFGYDANPDATRAGTLTVGNRIVTVTQAGSTYVAAGQLTTLVSSGLSYPNGVAVDSGGNLYIADTSDNAIKKWTATNNTVTTLVSTGLSGPGGVAVDGEGNVYIADTTNNAIKEWSASNNTLTTLVSNATYPQTVAVDGVGDIFFANYNLSQIEEWQAASNTVTTAANVNCSFGVALDLAGDIYAVSACENTLTEQYAYPRSGAPSRELASGMSSSRGVAVDGQGNAYVANIVIDTILKHAAANIVKWTAASNTTNTLISLGTAEPYGVAVDGAGNIYIADAASQSIEELPRAFVDAADRLESLSAGTDSLPAVLPAAEILLGPFAPTTDEPWLTITGITNGIVGFSFTASSSNRTGNITLLGQVIAITQGGPTYSLGTTALLEGPNTGVDSAILSVFPKDTPWTATANDSWLHLSLANQSGVGRTNVVFGYDENSGPTRSGTLTIGGQTLTVTQAGSTYVPAGLVTLVSSGLSEPEGVAVDGEGNVYIADSLNSAIKEWTAVNNTVTPVVSSGLNEPGGLTIDRAGNLYFTDSGNLVKKWAAADNTVTTMFAIGIECWGVAVDEAGNLYIVGASDRNGTVQEWMAANSNVITLFQQEAGGAGPNSVAVDGAGNVYIADTWTHAAFGAISEWESANSNLTTLVPNDGASLGVALDGSGDLFIAHSTDTIEKWSAADQTVSTLLPPGSANAFNLAVDSAENVYFSVVTNNSIEELPHAFVDPRGRLEGTAAGSDALPTVVPATQNLLGPLSPISDQSWLTITGVTNGVVSFSFTANAGSNRTANITLLGRTILVTQLATDSPTVLSSIQMLGTGALQIDATNIPGPSVTVLTTTNLSLPVGAWMVLGTFTNTAARQCQITVQPTSNELQRFYAIQAQ